MSKRWCKGVVLLLGAALVMNGPGAVRVIAASTSEAAGGTAVQTDGAQVSGTVVQKGDTGSTADRSGTTDNSKEKGARDVTLPDPGEGGTNVSDGIQDNTAAEDAGQNDTGKSFENADENTGDSAGGTDAKAVGQAGTSENKQTSGNTQTSEGAEGGTDTSGTDTTAGTSGSGTVGGTTGSDSSSVSGSTDTNAQSSGGGTEVVNGTKQTGTGTQAGSTPVIAYKTSRNITAGSASTGTTTGTSDTSTSTLKDVSQELKKAEDYLAATVTEPVVGSVGGEWAVLDLARYGNISDAAKSAYLANLYKTLDADKGILHEKKYTEYSRVIIALSSLNLGATNVNGYNLLKPLAEYENTIWQGNNGAIFALIAFDTRAYEIPTLTAEELADKEATQATRERYKQAILDAQLTDGGWSLNSGIKTSDPDMTAMALQALAPYYKEAAVKAAIDRALDTLGGLQDADGGFSSWGTTNAESVAQTIVALSAIDVHLFTDARFMKNGKGLIDNILSYQLDDGSFTHTNDAGASGNDAMTTEQATYALLAYERAVNGQTSLYDMTDIATNGTGEASKEDIAAIKAQIAALPKAPTLADEQNIYAVQSSLSQMPDFDEKESLAKTLDALLAKEKQQQAVVDALNKDIWNQINPSRLSTKDEKAVLALKARYDALPAANKVFVENAKDIAAALEKIESLKKTAAKGKGTTGGSTTNGGATNGSVANGNGSVNGNNVSGGNTVKGSKATGGSKAANGANASSGKTTGLVISGTGKGTGEGTGGTGTKAASDGTGGTGTKAASDGASLPESTGGLHSFLNQVFGNSSSGGTGGQATSGASHASGQASASGAAHTSGGWYTLGNTGSTGTKSKTSAGTSANKNAKANQTTKTGQTTTANQNSAESTGNTTEVTARNHMATKEQLEAVKGKDQNLKVTDQTPDGEKYTFTINGKDIKTAADLNVKFSDRSRFDQFIQELAPDPLILNFEQNGDFPGAVLAEIPVDKADGTYLLFYYNPDTEKAEYIQKVDIKDKKTKFILTKGGDYFIDTKARVKSVKELRADEKTSAKKISDKKAAETAGTLSVQGTKKTNHTPLVIGIVLAAVVVAGGAGAGLWYFKIYKKRKQ